MSEKPSRKRRLLKWSIRAAIGLLVLSVLALVGADRWRSHVMSEHQARLHAAFDVVDSEILRGRTPAEWHASRVHGSNGWQYLKFLDREDTDQQDQLLHDACRQLDEYQAGTWRDVQEYSDVEPSTTPTTEQLEAWLEATQPMADALERAAGRDCIVRLPAENEPYAQWLGVSVLKRLRGYRALVGRCKALRTLGRGKQAQGELETFTEAMSKLVGPTSLVDAATIRAATTIPAAFALDLLVAGTLYWGEARRLLAWRPREEFAMREALEAETVWLYTLTHESGYLLSEPSWFDWLTCELPRGRGMFAVPEDDDSIQVRWARPINLSREVATAVEVLLRLREYLNSPSAWNPDEVPQTPEGLLAFSSGAMFEWRNGMLKRDMVWLELELRILELEGGPLVNQKDKIADVISDYPGLECEFDEDDLIIGVSSQYLEDTKAVQGMLTGEGYDKVLRPINELRNPPEDEDYDDED